MKRAKVSGALLLITGVLLGVLITYHQCTRPWKEKFYEWQQNTYGEPGYYSWLCNQVEADLTDTFHYDTVYYYALDKPKYQEGKIIFDGDNVTFSRSGQDYSYHADHSGEGYYWILKDGYPTEVIQNENSVITMSYVAGYPQLDTIIIYH